MYIRALKLPKNPSQSLFLWGPRQTGKTTLLKQTYPQAYRVDLLKSDILMRYLQHPYVFREEIMALPQGKLIVVDGDSIKELGKYTAKVKLHKEVEVDLQFEVIAE